MLCCGSAATAGPASSVASPVSSQPAGEGGRWQRLAQALAVPGLRGAEISALVLDRRTGEPLFARSPDRLLIPASTQKLLTATAVLARFGPAHRFATQVLANAPPDARGEVADLFVRGSDPAMTSEQWWRLAADLHAAGLCRVGGDLVLDDGRLDDQRWHPSWGPVSVRAYHAAIGALSANYGAFRVIVRPGAGPGAPARVQLDPPVSYLEVADRARTAGPGGRPALTVTRELLPSSERVVVSGTIPRDRERVEVWRSVARPALYAGAVLRMQLEANGIPVAGRLRRAAAPDHAAFRYDFEGLPLARVVALALKYSNNFIAEVLVKQLGFLFSGRARPGSWANGIPALRSSLAQLGVDLGPARLVDGSGLSRSNRLSARMLATTLRRADAAFGFGPELLAALPLAAEDGTLAERADGASGRLRAKTGSLDGVTGLAGLARTVEGRDVVFALLVNGTGARERAAVAAVDGFAAALVEGGARP